MGSAHSGIEFLGQIGIVLVAALIGGLVARALRLPVLIGYLLAGIVIGPHTPGFIANEETVKTVADLGVALLMFAVGVQFSLDELNHVRRIALVGGGAQILGTVLLGLLLGIGFGWGLYGGLFLGCALALSSTAVMLKVLEERGELGSAHGNAMLGILVVQDLSLVLMIILLPALSAFSTEGAKALVGVGIALLKAVLFLLITVVMATRGAPALLNRVAKTGSRELFLLTVVCLCLVAGYAADQMGLGLALGAFLAGIVVSESGYAHEVFGQVRPLRDVFASVFFVSVGMLLDPAFVVANYLIITAVVLTILVGKSLLTMMALHLLGTPGRVVVLTGLGLAQIGEFSFVLATVGAARGLIEPEVSSVILSSALITILLAPFVFGAGGTVYQRALRVPLLAGLLNQPRSVDSTKIAEPGGSEAPARVLVLGAGRVGRYVSDALREKGVAHVVLDYDANASARLRENGVPVVYGDVTSETVLEKVTPRSAELAVIALPEAATTEMALRLLKQMAPDLPVVVRVHRGNDIPRMRAAGADAVIHAEFEAGTEMIRQGLDRLGFADKEVETYLDGVRSHRYREEGVEG
ncbi:MAG: cation:proton antiporter [Fibrella sp.]|nr:cation:proton antiporter [Armatimonadota bacterium]